MEIRRLPVKLDAEEVALRADELARKVEELGEINRRVDAVKEETKAQVKELEAAADQIEHQISELAEMVRTHYERQEVECSWERNEQENPPRMELVRSDLGQVVESRPMTVEERQRILFPSSKSRAAGDGEAS